MAVERTIIVGDIHGCIEEFEELIDKISYNKESDRLILLGDLIDRGPDSVGVVRKAREMNIESVIGNHEFKFLKWFKSNRAEYNAKEHYYNHFSDEDIDYIFKMPTYIKIENNIIVHAGLKPNLDISKQYKNDLMYLRYTDKNGNFISVHEVKKYGKEAAGAYFWTEFYKGPESVIYGHHVHSYDSPLIEEVSPNIFCYGLDTGCCYGGNLTALILESKEIIQIKAKKKYHPSLI